MQRRILLIGSDADEVQRILGNSFQPAKQFLFRDNLKEALEDISGREKFSLVLAKPDHLRNVEEHLHAQASHYFNTKTRPSSENTDVPELVGQSDAILEVRQQIRHVAPTESRVLIEGESGTGKELVARAIHFHSHRSHKPFVKVNCAALAQSLIESELFGHVRGAFTGAVNNRKGRFVQANGGTLLLDEIGSMPLESQAKFLRVLQDQEFEPVGSSVTRKTDVRVLATDNSDLEQAVEAGIFREDLFYRLRVFPITVPALRARMDDVPALARHFLGRHSHLNSEVLDFSDRALEIMLRYDWPGNIRELENTVQHALIVERSNRIEPWSLPIALEKLRSVKAREDDNMLRMREKLNLYEKQLIQEALLKSRGRKMKAAQILGVNPKNFGYLLRKHDLT